MRIPKELIARFIKLCPTCRNRRGIKPVVSFGDTRRSIDGDSPLDNDESALQSRRDSTATSQCSTMVCSPSRFPEGSPTFQNQNRWMDCRVQASTQQRPLSPTLLEGFRSSEFRDIGGYDGTSLPSSVRLPKCRTTGSRPRFKRE